MVQIPEMVPVANNIVVKQSCASDRCFFMLQYNGIVLAMGNNKRYELGTIYKII